MDLGLNEHHQTALLNYMRFARCQRAQYVRSIQACFDDVRDSRLVEDTYTKDEVLEVLGGLAGVVKAELEGELIDISHTQSALLQQLCSQAEQWHLKLQINTEDLENRELLDKMKQFENQESIAGGIKAPGLSGKAPRLEPIGDTSGSTALLQREVDRLQHENNTFRERLKTLETQVTSVLEEKSNLSTKLSETRAEVGRLTSELSGQQQHEAAGDSAELQQLREQLSALQMSAVSGQEKVNTDLASTKHKLLEIQEQLDMAERELEKKFSQTAAYSNMKKMLAKKNDQLKELRRLLQRYQPDVDGGGQED